MEPWLLQRILHDRHACSERVEGHTFFIGWEAAGGCYLVVDQLIMNYVRSPSCWLDSWTFAIRKKLFISISYNFFYYDLIFNSNCRADLVCKIIVIIFHYEHSPELMSMFLLISGCRNARNFSNINKCA